MKRVALGVALAVLAASADAYNLPAVNLGFTTFLDGGPPAGPGFYFTQYFQYYHSGETIENIQGNPVVMVGELNAYISLSQFIYQSDQKVFLNGKWGLDLIVPVVSVETFAHSPPYNDWGGGDLLVGPYLQWDPIMGKHGPIFMHRLELQCIFPTGKYDDKYAINPGSNVFSLDPYWAGTLFLFPRLSLSTRIHYLWNTENTDPFIGTGANNLQPGQAVHLNFATELEVLPKHLRVGLNGYFLKQITATEANGHNIGDREQVLGIGPGLVWHISQNDHFFANVYFETAVKRRTKGERYNFRWVHHF